MTYHPLTIEELNQIVDVFLPRTYKHVKRLASDLIGARDRIRDLESQVSRMQTALKKIQNRRGSHGYCLDCGVHPGEFHAASCSVVIATEALYPKGVRV